MDLGFTEEQKKFRQEVVRFCKEEMESGSRSPDFAASFQRKIAEKGWTGPVSYTHLTLPTTPYV